MLSQVQTELENKPQPINEDSEQIMVYADLSRRDVRSLIFHLLYAADSFDYTVSVETLVENYNRGFDWDIPLDSDTVRMARGVIEQRDALDEQVKPFLVNWRFDRLGVCTKLILRLALWELNQGEPEASIVINEAIELAKCFAEKDAYKFINGILDRAVKGEASEEEVLS